LAVIITYVKENHAFQVGNVTGSQKLLTR